MPPRHQNVQMMCTFIQLSDTLRGALCLGGTLGVHAQQVFLSTAKGRDEAHRAALVVLASTFTLSPMRATGVVA